jgi:hypothetical protein
MSSTTVMPAALRALISDHEQRQRDQQDAAAAAVSTELAAFDAFPPALEKLLRATVKARATCDALRTQLRDAEHALGVAATQESQQRYELGELHRRLRRGAVAPWRLEQAIARLQTMADDRFNARQSADGRVAMAGHRVLVDHLQRLRALATGDADPVDVDAFVDATVDACARAENAASVKLVPSQPTASSAPARFLPPLVRR